MRASVIGCLLAAALVPPVGARPLHGWGSLKITSLPTFGPGNPLTFGALTPAGYGGTLAGSTLDPATNPLRIVSASGGCSAANWVIDPNGMLVPNDAATHSYATVRAKFGYTGAISGETSGCTLVLTNGRDTASDTVAIQPHTFTIRGMWGLTFNHDGVLFGGNAYSTQLFNILMQASNSSLPVAHLGDTFVCRDSQLWYDGSTKSSIIVPTGGWATGTGGYASNTHILITSEHPASGTDANGNPVQGGGCQMAQLSIQELAGNYIPLNIDFKYINFAEDAVTPAGVPLVPSAALPNNGKVLLNPLIGLPSGWSITHSNFSVGDNVQNPDGTNAGIIGASSSYAGTEGGAALAAEAVTFNDNHMYHTTVNLQGVSGHAGLSGNGVAYPGAGAWPYYTALRNVFQDSYEKGFSLMAEGGADIEDNFMFNMRGTGGQHPDMIIFSSSCVYNSGVCSGGTPDNHLYSTLQNATAIIHHNISIHGAPVTNSAATLTALDITTNPPTSPTNGSYLLATTSPGAGRTAWVRLAVSNCASACQYAATIDGSPYPTGGRGYAVGDTLYFAYAGGVLSAQVASLVPYDQDSLGIFQATANAGDSPSTFDVVGNIVDSSEGNQITLSFFSAATVNNNDAAVDFLNYPPTAAPTNGRIYADGNPSATGDFDYNVSNTYGLTGGFTCGSCYTMPSKTADAYHALWPNWNPTLGALGTSLTSFGYPSGFNRASAIASHTPSPACLVVSAPSTQCPTKNGDGSYSGALWPSDYAGVVAWAIPGVVFDPAATHAPAR